MPKYADPAVYPVTAPAADDTAMARTNAGGDRNFLLGNLAGLAPLVMAADQSVYSTGPGLWAAYSLTTAGRALTAVAGTADTFPYFSASNVAALATVTAQARTFLAAPTLTDQRSVIAAVGLAGAETITGAKTFSALITFTDSFVVNRSTGTINMGAISGLYPGMINTYITGTDSYRSEFRGNAGYAQIGCNSVSGGGTPGRFLEVSLDYVRPSANNVMSCGQAARAWTQLFAQNTTVSTSDARLKTEPRQLRDAEFKAASAIARLPAVWRWIHRVEGDETCEPEGKEARKHFGPTVQAAIAVMEAHGLDPFAYSFICYDEWEAEPEQWHEWPDELDDDGNVIREAGRELVQAARQAGDRYSFRKEELLCFLVAAMARQHDELEARVAALEAKLTA
ncbi:tail fiber domain-containing protein [Stenotrophomonas sp. NPDC078853]|uniref:tail fiber domain-containing protein n=1 Tax=Stenotrophomonas sp. NPDC078853 TaxID=3364534 RepID=UPI00384C26B2